MKVKMIQQSKKTDALLVGPFIGELSWEFYRFAPYIIYLKKENPQTKLIVFTRPSRFDLYGKYADILVPLKIPNEKKEKQYYFTHRGFSQTHYRTLTSLFAIKYGKRYKIVKHIYPDISTFYYKLKWQFPRDLADYDYKPRYTNSEIVDYYVGNDDIVLVNSTSTQSLNQMGYLESIGKYPVFIDLFCEYIKNEIQETFSFIGCIIELIKRCDFVVSKFDSSIFNLSLLLKTPIITIGETLSTDAVSLLNPLKTPVIVADEIETGIELWKELVYNENNF